MFDPIERSSVASSAVLILDPSSSSSSFIDWQACCGDFVVPVRSKRGCSSSWVKLCPRAGRARPADLVNRERPPCGSMAIAKALARTDESIRRPATKNRRPRPCARGSDHPAPSPNVSCAFPILTRTRLTPWAGTKRGYGAKRRKPSGRLMR
jgi:hypothetical protein